LEKRKALYFYTGLSSFVRKDILIISDQFDVKPFAFLPKTKIRIIFIFLSEFFFILRNIIQADILICQFGGYHTLFPTLFGRIFRKPCLIITGGADCAALPSIHYGNFSNKALSLFLKSSYRLATHISPVHETLMFSKYTYQDNDFPNQGLLYFCPKVKTPYTVIYNGYDSSVWKKNKQKVKNRFITVVANIKLTYTCELKGIDLITQVAPRFPDCEFYVIGIPEEYDLQETSKNIKKIAFVNHDEIASYFSEAEFYLQLSMSEGFPNALCEAMLCECIPVVSNVGAMPFIVDDCGFILERRDVDLLEQRITSAITCDKEAMGKKARNRISSSFTEDMRKEKLLNLINKLLQ